MNSASISGARFRVEERHVQQVIIVQHVAADAELFRDQTDGGNATALAVAAIVHLARRLVNMPTGDRLAAAEPDNAAAAFFRFLSDAAND